MNFGCDYYPEHWPESRWSKDVQMMKDAGFNTVRLAEFAWSKMEPNEGSESFDWLDTVIDLLHQEGIAVVLGTPTAAPPAWFVQKHPESLRVDETGRRTAFGGRRQCCPNSPAYRKYSKKITERMANRYGHDARVIGWQIDNEFGGDKKRGLCYCSNCLDSWHAWLEHKFGSLSALNEAWGTAFWAQTYDDWSQIPLPVVIETAHNPSLLVNYRRFISDSYIEYQQDQVDILTNTVTGHFVTHNLMLGHFDSIDYYKLAKPLDKVVWDNYPKLKFIGTDFDYTDISFSHDVCRGIKDQPFWIMEEQSGPSGWQTVDPTPKPGEIRLWTYQAIAHGADGIVYFRWRTCRFGTEQFWHGILDASGVQNRRYREVRDTGRELARIADTIGDMTTPAEVAIINSYDAQWAFWAQPNNKQLKYREHAAAYYKAFNQEGVNVDVVSPGADLSRYKVVLAPTLYLLSDQLVEKLDAYVHRGGYLITTFRSGVRDWNNVAVEEPIPGRLGKILGVEVEEYDSLPPGSTRVIRLSDRTGEPISGEASLWCDIVQCHSATSWAHYAEDYYEGRPVITTNLYGNGTAVYVGTDPSANIKQRIVADALESRSILRNGSPTYNDVELVRKVGSNTEALFVLNHADQRRHIRMDTKLVDLLTGAEYNDGSEVVLAPKEVAILVPSKD